MNKEALNKAIEIKERLDNYKRQLKKLSESAKVIDIMPNDMSNNTRICRIKDEGFAQQIAAMSKTYLIQKIEELNLEIEAL